MLKKWILGAMMGCTSLSLTAEDKTPAILEFDWISAFHTHAAESMAFLDKPIDPGPLLQLLEQVRPIVKGVKPKKEDFAFVMSYLEPFLVQLQNATQETLQQTMDVIFLKITNLFYGDEFNLKQKAALFLILEKFAQSLSH